MPRQAFEIEGHIHFLTFSCSHRQQLFNDDDLCSLFATVLNDARENESFRTYAYVIMPEHIHLLIHPQNPDYSMMTILRRIKETFSRRAVKYLQEHNAGKLKTLQERVGNRTVLRFWQPGGGYDRNLFKPETVNRAIEYIEYNPVRRGLVAEPGHWKWSSAGARVGKSDVPLILDELYVDLAT